MKKTKQQQNREQAQEIVAEAKVDFNGEINANEIFSTPCFSGVNSGQKLDKISVKYNPEYPIHELPDYLKECAFQETFKSLVDHEKRHKKDCPKNFEKNIHKILIPCSDILKSRGFSNVPFGSQGHTLYSYFANLISDFAVNTISSNEIGSKGHFLSYDDDAVHLGGKFGKLFEGFLKLQTYLFPDKTGFMQVARHFDFNPDSNKAVNNFMERTGLKKLNKLERVNFLANEGNWKNISTIFTEEFSNLLDKNNMNAFYFPLFGGNDLIQVNDEDVQGEIAMKFYEAGKESGKFEPPAFMEDNSALLSVYRQLAKSIEFKTNSHSVETERPVSYAGTRKFDLEKDNLENMVYGLNEAGKLEMQIGKYELKVKSRYQISPGTFPEIRFGAVDCSGSTKNSLTGEVGVIMNPWANKEKQWTDVSIYHWELRHFFGLCDLFRRKGTLKSSNVKLFTFSDKENSKLAKDLEESEKIVLQPIFGDTYLNEDYLELFFEGEGSLVYMESDGEIGNWGDVKDNFIKKAKKHNFVFIQYGSKSQAYKDIKKAGLNTLLIDKDTIKNSDKQLVDFTIKQFYGEN
jgi:hypothetical protein